MPLQNFVDNSLPTIKAAWLNSIDVFYTTLFGSATTAAAARAAIGAGTGNGDAMLSGSTFTGLVNLHAGADIVSAATLDLAAATGNLVHVTGTVTITAVTMNPGQCVRVIADAALPLTYHATNNKLNGGANYVCDVGDTIDYFCDGTVVSGNITKANGTAVIGTSKLQDFRLTLTPATPVTTADVTGATTIYCTPYKGNQISLYSGTVWNTRTAAEFSLALGTLTSGKPYDVFCYDNSGTPTLEFLAWTNDTTRATALARQDGVLVKSGAATRRYLGTFYTTSTTETEDSAAKRYLWNYYHRSSRSMRRVDTTASWTYTTLVYRQANGNAANQLNMVIGVSEDSVRATVVQATRNDTGVATCYTAIGLDSTTTVAVDSVFALVNNVTAVEYLTAIANYEGFPGVGKHSLVWLEKSDSSGTTIWQGSTAGMTGALQG